MTSRRTGCRRGFIPGSRSAHLFFFFFYSYGAHRQLHSFPTRRSSDLGSSVEGRTFYAVQPVLLACPKDRLEDRKSTRLNSSHVRTSYAVFCLKKKNIPKPSAKCRSKK